MKFYASFAVAPLLFCLAGASILATRTSDQLDLDTDVFELQTRSEALPQAPPPLVIAPPLTNAQRLARSLPPAAPHHRSPLAPRHKAGASPVNVGGKIKVIRESDDMFFGWIEKSSISYKGIHGTWKITSDVSEALDVSFSAPADGTPFDVVQHGSNQSYPFFGGAASPRSAHASIKKNAYGYIWLSVTQHTDPVQPASNVGNALYGTTSKSESAIWTFDRMTRRLRPTWVNSDSQQVETFIVKRESGRELLLTADPDRLQQKSGTCWVMRFEVVY